MTPDPNTPKRLATEPDDDRLAALVRATAEDWTLPPQRLDAQTWRNRVATTGAGRRGWLARFGVPVSAAVVITLVAAFGAVWLSAPRPGPIAGASPSPSGTSATPTSGPTASSAPKVVVNGALPDPATVLVRAGEGYRLADLSTGALGPRVFGTHTGPTAVVARPGGGWLCVCSDWAGLDSGSPARVVVKLAMAGPTGPLEAEAPVRVIDGRADPGQPAAAQMQLVDARATFSRDGRFAFLGWAAREGAEGWKVGVDVIDVAAGRVIGSSGLPALPSATPDGLPVTRIAPEVDLATSGVAALVSDFWYVADDRNPSPSGIDHWSASFDGSLITGFKAASSTATASCIELAHGIVQTSAWWALCSTDGTMRFDRFDVDGTLIGSPPLPTFDGMQGPLLDEAGANLYIWGPVAKTLTRIDLASGSISSVAAKTAMTDSDPVLDLARAFGRWIAPPVAAKVVVDPGLVLSPDGKRLYALAADVGNGETVASQGVFVFDVATLEQVDHWPPAADLTSIAISPDGAWLYAAGQPGFDAGGVATGDPASITVYATADGSVRLSAGRLDYEGLSFVGPVLP